MKGHPSIHPPPPPPPLPPPSSSIFSQIFTQRKGGCKCKRFNTIPAIRYSPPPPYPIPPPSPLPPPPPPPAAMITVATGNPP
ncbi:hypothetical protein KSP40_PGU022591 [Platanthera guangdongensis]|uniref:Uncharacterized protein n=1 Tax=Platanthera guangdongensis TaxID=2320717 RepID=A0ABR2LX71_9ASPA